MAGTARQQAPNAWQMEQSSSIYLQVRAAAESDEQLTTDETILLRRLAEARADHPRDLLDRLIDAAVLADLRSDEAAALARAMRARSERYEQRMQTYKGWIADLLIILGEKSHDGPMGRVHFGGEIQSVVVTDATKLPDEYLRIKTEPNKTALAEALADGVVIEGAELSNPRRPLVLTKAK